MITICSKLNIGPEIPLLHEVNSVLDRLLCNDARSRTIVVLSMWEMEVPAQKTFMSGKCGVNSQHIA